MNKLLQFLLFGYALTCTHTIIAKVEDTQKEERPSGSIQPDKKLSTKKPVGGWATSPVQVCAKNQTHSPFHMQMEGERSPSLSSDICDSESSCGSSYTNSGPDYPPGPSSEEHCFTLSVSECCDLMHTRFWVWTPNGNVLGCDPHDNIPLSNWPNTPTLNYTLYWGNDVPNNCVRGQGGFCCVLEN